MITTVSLLNVHHHVESYSCGKNFSHVQKQYYFPCILIFVGILVLYFGIWFQMYRVMYFLCWFQGDLARVNQLHICVLTLV